MTEQEKAREAARLLLAWVERKTLQQLGKPGQWSDYVSEKMPIIFVLSNWRIKPEPRTVWLADTVWPADPSGSALVHVATTPEQAEELRKKHFVVTEWKEVVS